MFKGLADDRLRWLAITLCLFRDTRLTDFWRLYELLSAHGRALQESRQPGAPPAPAAAPPAPPPSLFAENDADMLLAVHGEVTTVETRLETGPGVARRVRFEDGEMQNAMPGFLRENHHALLIGLVPLLERLVKEGGLEVRIAAARALGAIGALDCERLLQPLLERWRDSDAAFLRVAVGYALDAALAENQAGRWEGGKLRAGRRWPGKKRPGCLDVRRRGSSGVDRRGDRGERERGGRGTRGVRRRCWGNSCSNARRHATIRS